jgi:DNA-binding transcriptional MerR regulator
MTPRSIYVNVNKACMVIRNGAPRLEESTMQQRRTMTQETMTIRDMCAKYDVTPRTLRFYEQKELLFPIRDGQRRLFTKSDRARLKLILRGKRFGFKLEEIRQLLALYHMGDSQQTQLAQTFELAKTHLADMIAQRDELNVAIEELTTQMKWGATRLADLASGKVVAT